MSRSIDRRREFAMRSRPGREPASSRITTADRKLCCCPASGAIVGFLGAAIGVWLLVRSIPEAQLTAMPYLQTWASASRSWHFVAGITVLTAILFGLRTGFIRTTNSDHRSAEGRIARRHQRLGARMRTSLVIGEIAISLVLLVAGGLMLQSLHRVLRQNPGFEPDHVLTFLVSLSTVVSGVEALALHAIPKACSLSTSSWTACTARPASGRFRQQQFAGGRQSLRQPLRH